MEATLNKELIKFEEVNSTLMTAESVLMANRSLFEKAEAKAKSLLDTVEAEGMSDGIDEEINKWQLNAKKALEINNERRAPITQILTKIASEFTSLENPLNSQKPDSYYSKLQLHRNGWAKQKADIQKAKEAEILKQQNIAKELNELKAEAEKQIRANYNKKLFAFKSHVSSLVNNATLETFQEVTTKIKDVKIDYPREAFNKLECSLFPIYADTTTVDGIIDDAHKSLYNELSANFRENMEVDKQNALDQLPSRKKELELLAKANAEEAEKIRLQAEKRQKAQEVLLKKEQEEKAKADEAKLQADQQLNNAQTLFDTASQLAEVKESAGKTKTSYVIEVVDAAGWGAVFMFFFEKVGMTLDVETFGKKTMNQMKKELEKIANTTSEKLDHPKVRYIEDVKAVVTK
ncbi:hypothetical protein [Sphingobacterium yanglingense]|uniref:Uncharacterized protein n=1 Tax=Sphingobacterium yanglingense TaxID=1437280 RepID=A0A4R6WH62_9SPHI|nr:hypothetical protein [Sphingobacterium yanglingense]TDQ79530.1 hypothetical protein CLV99_0972 [Sphingobacterium yanglingense]